VVKAGTYEVALQYLCPAARAGARVEIAVAEQRMRVNLRAASGGQVPSPDRVPRTEVYEMEWATLLAGRLRLPAGKTRLTVRALTRPSHTVMALKAVTLKRINSRESK
jgi:arylsulfatase A